jgi:hypothetical protein
MKIKAEFRVTPDLIKYHEGKEELFFRRLATEIVSKTPIEELKKIIEFTKIDFRTDDFIEKMYSTKTSKYEKELLISLFNERMILFKAELNIEDKSK